MITVIVMTMMIIMMMMSILTSTISASCSFYSYIPHFPSPPSPSFTIPLFYSAIFMEDTAEEVRIKIKKAYCPPEVVENNPVMDYATSIGKLPHPLIPGLMMSMMMMTSILTFCNLCFLLFLFIYSSLCISFFYCP